MKRPEIEELLNEASEAIVSGARDIGILGNTPAAAVIAAALPELFDAISVKGIFAGIGQSGRSSAIIRPMVDLEAMPLDLLIVASDEGKEELLAEALAHVLGTPRVLIAGYAHHAYRSRIFRELVSEGLVPSLANGYPHTLVHLFQCLENAARRGLSGVVAEFGMFKGGTTAFLAHSVRRLGRSWPVLGFDTFGGFPPPRSILDMYSHPDCVFRDEIAVRGSLAHLPIEVITGDVVSTCHRLDNEDVLLTFVDTDNYTSASAIIEVVAERTVRGGAIVFDHFTGVDRFKYTIGEKIAGKKLLEDDRYFQLHGTGVFFRQA